MDEQNVVYPSDGILFSLKKETVTPAATWINPEDILLR
jgi:hypothetical protein